MDSRHILIVEDPHEVARMMRDLLVDFGFITTICEPEVALETAKVLEPDVVIADLLMEGIDARAFHAALGTFGFQCELVVCSAWPGASALAEELGVRFVNQPFDIDDLAFAVNSLGRTGD